MIILDPIRISANCITKEPVPDLIPGTELPVANNSGFTIAQIANRMVNPISEAVDYRSIARRFLQVSQLQLGEVAVVYTDIPATNHLFDDSTDVIRTNPEGQIISSPVSRREQNSRLTIDTRVIGANAMIPWNLLTTELFPPLQRLLDRLTSAIVESENSTFMSLITSANFRTESAVNNAIVEQMANGLTPTRILASPLSLAKLIRSDLVSPTADELAHGIMGYISGLELIINPLVPNDLVFVFPTPRETGSFLIRQPLRIDAMNDVPNFRDTFSAWEDVGMVLTFPRNIIAVPV